MQPVTADIEAALESLRTRIEATPELSSEDAAGLVAQLSAVYHRLRSVADQLGSARHDRDGFTSDGKLDLWQHDRLIAVLPVAVVVTDEQGRITMVNAAAASLFRTRVDRMLRRPLESFVDPPDRAGLRRCLAEVLARGTEARATVAVVQEEADPRAVGLAASVAREPGRNGTDVTWVLVAPSRPVDSPSPSLHALVELTRLPLHSRHHAAVLRRAAEICATGVGGGASVTITVGHPAAPALLASSDGRAQQVDGAQIAADEGPCADAWDSGDTVVSHHLARDPRWPAMAARLDGMAVAVAAVAAPLRIGNDPMGVLNVYFPGGGVPPEAPAVTALLGTAVAAILHEIEAKGALETLAEQLRSALDSRAQIEQAKGMIMARQGCTADVAFRVLVDLSSRRNVKLRDVAAAMVAEPDADETGT